MCIYIFICMYTYIYILITQNPKPRQVTGDSALTGVAVAEATQLIPPGHRVIMADTNAAGEVRIRPLKP